MVGWKRKKRTRQVSRTEQIDKKTYLNDEWIDIDNHPAENAIQSNVISRKKLLSVSEGGATVNAICFSITETVKVNGVDLYQYIVKLMKNLSNL